MHPVRKLSVLAGVALAIAAVAPSVSAQSAAPAPNELHVTKDCSSLFTGQPGSICTITASNLEAIPVGSRYIYYGPALDNPMFLSSSMVLDAGDGNTAIGWCVLDPHAGPLGMCSFWAGTGTLTGFNAIVQVTVDTTGAWHLDGTYLFAPAG